jgi:hypothetical protein
MTDHLATLAKRLEGDPYFLACALQSYADSERLDDAALARTLQCTPETLVQLKLCRAPDVERFREDIDKIAARFAVDRNALAQAARQGQVLVHSRHTAPAGHGLLLAARDGDGTSKDTPEVGP